MPKASVVQTNLTAGELSPKMLGRVDVNKYVNGAEQIQNFIVTPYGGAQRTPGTRFIGEARKSSVVARLVPFQFSTEQTYMLSFNDGKIVFFRNQGRVVEAAITITGVTQANPGVVTAPAHGLSTNEDVVLSGIVGMTRLNGNVYRMGATTVNTFELKDPQTGANVDTSAYAAYTSGGTLARVYDVNHDYADADLKDLRFAQTADVMYIVHPSYSPRKLSRTGHTAWTLATVTFVDGPFLPQNTTATTLTPSVSAVGATGTLTASTAIFTAAADDPTTKVIGQLFKLHGGVVKVTDFTSTTVLQITVVSVLSATTATAAWSEGAWSPGNGNPGAVSFFEQRLAFAGSTNNPQTVWLSVSESYEDMDVASAGADDALIYTIASDQVNAIRWLSAAKTLLLGTSGGVFSLSSGDDATPLTPTNVVVKRETTFGAATLVPKQIGNYAFYVQRDTLIVRELAYSLEIDQQKAANITILSEHITAGGIVDMDYQQSPNNLLWCVRGDGKIATLTREIDQEVAAWTEQTPSGTSPAYENVAVIQSSTVADGDEVWLVVKRTINGATHRYVELLETFDWGADNKDAFFVQSGLTYDGASVSTIIGLDHLEGQTVDVYADGAVQAQQTVTNGALTLATAAAKVQAGLAYDSTIKTLRVEAGSAIGTSQGQLKRINNVIVRVLKTLQLKVGTPTTQYDQDLTAIKTGDVEAHHDGGWETEGQVVVKCDDPVPCHVIAIIQQLTEEDR